MKIKKIVVTLTVGALTALALFSMTLLRHQASESTGEMVQLFYYQPGKDTDAAGNILCSEAGLTAVKRETVTTDSTTPDNHLETIRQTLTLLLAGELTTEERSQGIETEFPLPGVSLTELSQKENTLTITIADPQNKTSGGSCRVGVLRSQIEATAKQFPGVTEVKILPEELFQP